jgi:hypothetical protein
MMAIDLSQYDEDTRMAAAALLEMKRREQSLKRISGLWEPQSEAQRMALASPAQELFFGGAAGGGKSDLLLGAALTRHWKSIILRREFPQMRAICWPVPMRATTSSNISGRRSRHRASVVVTEAYFTSIVPWSLVTASTKMIRASTRDAIMV